MSFFGRIRNLFGGMLGIFITQVEASNPDAVYEASIAAQIANFSKYKQAAAGLVRRRIDINERLDKATSEYNQVIQDLEAAVASNADDMAILLIQKRDQLGPDIEALNTDLDQADKDAEEAKSGLIKVRQEIDNLKAERNRMIARYQSAKVRLQIHESLDGLSTDSTSQALAGVRETIKNTVASANLSKELRENDIDTKLDKLRKSSASTTAQSKLDELKRQHAIKKTEQQKVSNELQVLVEATKKHQQEQTVGAKR